MNLVAQIIMVIGGVIALLAGVGLIKFDTTYARFHAAGKASPVAFLVTAAGAALELGWEGTVYLVIASVAMILTLPLGVHLLFRSVYRATAGHHLAIDELADANGDEQ